MIVSLNIRMLIPLLTASACVSTTLTPTGGEPAAQTSASSAAQSRENDIRAIEQILKETSDAWNRHDPEGLVAHSADDIDHIGVNGRWTRGRAELHSAFVTVAPRINNSVIGSVESVRFLTPDIAVAIISRQYKSATETRNAIGTSVFQRINGEWLVTAFQNTYVQ
jgi:uncharacterized protein (TIGR02246 family)